MHVILTVHLVTCEHSLAHLYCGKFFIVIIFSLFVCMQDSYDKYQDNYICVASAHLSEYFTTWSFGYLPLNYFSILCIVKFSSSFCQMRGWLYLSTVLTMDAATRPHALTWCLLLRLKMSTAQTPLQ